MEGVSLFLEAAAQADNISCLFRRLEACGQLLRLDPVVEPTMYRCATVSQAELAHLRGIDNVIRLGRVTHIGPDQIELADGSIPTDRGQVHVDCAAAGLRTKPSRPVFSDSQITLQQIRACQPVFGAALTGYVEATRDDYTQKNQICPANPYPDTATDWIPVTCTSQRGEIIWATDPDLSSWMQHSRLNATRGIRDHQDDPQMKSALGRVNGHEEICADGRVISWLSVTGYPGGWPVFLPAGCQGMATTPFPARASARRWESPAVCTRWAWCSSRSTVAVARVLGMIVSNPDGWMLLVTARLRRS